MIPSDKIQRTFMNVVSTWKKYSDHAKTEPVKPSFASSYPDKDKVATIVEIQRHADLMRVYDKAYKVWEDRKEKLNDRYFDAVQKMGIYDIPQGIQILVDGYWFLIKHNIYVGDEPIFTWDDMNNSIKPKDKPMFRDTENNPIKRWVRNSVNRSF